MYLIDLAHDLRKWRRRQLHKRRVAEVAHGLSETSGYSFTADWVEQHGQVWRALSAPIAGRPGLRILEIGSFEGRSAVWFLENVLTHPSADITCLDIFADYTLPGYGTASDGYELRFDHNIRVSGQGHRVTKLKGASHDLLPGLPRAGYDVIYIDGAHDTKSVLLDTMLSWPLLKPGGLLVFDDYLYIPTLPPVLRPQMAIDLFLGFVAGQYELLHKGYQVALRKSPA